MRCYRIMFAHLNWATAIAEVRASGAETREVMEARVNGDIADLEGAFGEVTIHQVDVAYADPEIPLSGTMTLLYSYEEDPGDEPPM